MRWVKWDDGPLQYNTSASVSGGLVIRARNQVMQLRTENCLIELNWIGLDWIGLDCLYHNKIKRRGSDVMFAQRDNMGKS